MNFLSLLFGRNTNDQVTEAIKEGAFIVDVRTPAEFSAGSVKKAVNIPLSEVKKQLPKFKGKKNIIVFCRSGNRSSEAKRILEQNGFSNVINGGSLYKMNKVINF